MASISFTLPAGVAEFLSANVPGFPGAPGGGDTVTLEVPALPAPVVAGLEDAGIQVAPATDPAVVPIAAAPVEVAPVGAAAAPQDLVAFGQAVEAFFEQAAANPFPAPPADLSEIAAWGAAQQQAALDYFGGV